MQIKDQSSLKTEDLNKNLRRKLMEQVQTISILSRRWRQWSSRE